MRFLLCILFSAFLFTTVKSLIATNVYNPTTCGLPGPGFKDNKLRAKARKYVGNDVKRIVKRDIDKDYSVDYNPTAGDETEEDENDPMQTKSGSDYTRDFAILELTDDVPKHIHHICLPHMNKNIGIGDSSLRMSSFGWGSDRVKMTKKECKKFYPKKLDDTFCTFERVDECTCEGDSGGGVTAKIGYRTYLVGVLSRGTPCKDLYSGRQEPKAQLHTDITKYTALIDSWLGAKKPK